jgi:hypothetical protein
VGKSIAEMSARGITISTGENMQVLALFPKVYHLYILGLVHAAFCRWLALQRRFTTVVPLRLNLNACYELTRRV